MSGAHHRRKGARLEREIVDRHVALGADAERYPLSSASYCRGSGHDVYLYVFGRDETPLTPEVKGRKSGAGFTLERWLGHYDPLFLRRNNSDPLIVLPGHAGSSIDEIDEVLAKYPNGIGNKYAGRLRDEIERSYGKWAASCRSTLMLPTWPLPTAAKSQHSKIRMIGMTRISRCSTTGAGNCRNSRSMSLVPNGRSASNWPPRRRRDAGARRRAADRHCFQPHRDRSSGPGFAIVVAADDHLGGGRRCFWHRQDAGHRRHEARA